MNVRVQDFMVRQTEWAVGNLYRNVRRMPEDKLAWKVESVGRSPLDMLQECAGSALWPVPMLRDLASPEWNPERWEALKTEMSRWDTVDKCEEAHQANLARLVEAMQGLADEDLEKEITIPFAPAPVPMATILTFHYWNVTYHLGQILFVQTLYGDNEMAF